MVSASCYYVIYYPQTKAFNILPSIFFYVLRLVTGNPSSKYEHRRASALLRNIQNIRICMGKKPIVSVTYENETISIKNSLPYLKCVLRLSCVTSLYIKVYLYIERKPFT